MGAVFAIIGGIIHWFPLILGIRFNRVLLNIQFFIIFVGVNITFFPQHFLGLNGMTRRYSDYPDVFFMWNIVSSLGRYTSTLAILLFIIILWNSLTSNKINSISLNNTSSIEWILRFPPSDHTYNERIIILEF